MVCVLVEEEWLIKIIITWYMLAFFTRCIRSVLSTNAVGRSDIITRGLGISKRSPNIALLTERCDLQQTTEFQVTTTYVSLISSGKASGILPAFLHISRGLYVGTCLSIPPHRTGALWGSDGSDSPCLLPDICWMNEWVKYFPCTPALTSLRQCLAQRRNKYWMNSYICEYRDSEELCCITGFCLNISKPNMSFLHCFS